MAGERVTLENLTEYTDNMFSNSNILKRNSDYILNNVVNKGQIYLKCTQAGRTAVTALSLSNVSIGDTLTDGTVEWEVISILGVPSNIYATSAQIQGLFV